MRIYIEYEVPTASGNKSVKGLFVNTIAEAEEYCEIIKINGLKIINVSVDGWR